MDIRLSRNNGSPIYIQIKNGIKQKILDGELLHSFKLPPERVLAASLGVHRNTVIKAYQALIEEDFISVSSSPRGYFVCYRSVKDLEYNNLSKKDTGSFDYMVKNEYRQMNKLFSQLFEQSVSAGMISFAAQLASPDTLPKQQIKEILSDLIAEGSDELYGYCHAQGLETLRHNISRILSERKINASPSEIQIVTESGQALDYLMKIYMNPGDTIIVEEPILSDSFNYFSLMGIRPIPISMDHDGMMTGYLESLIVKHRPKFIYTIPDFHNPTGAVMSLERRYSLLALAGKYNIPIIEEGCDYSLRYEGPSLPPLAAIDKNMNVLYIDSFIFSFFPGARIAYMSGPRHVITKVSNMLDLDQIFINSISQYLTGEFISRGYFKKHMRIICQYYQEKRDLMIESLSEVSDVTFEKPSGGTCIWCKLPEHINQTQLLKNALALGVSFIPGYLFYPYGNKGENYIRLSFSDVPKEDIPTGIRLLKEAMEKSIKSTKGKEF